MSLRSFFLALGLVALAGCGGSSSGGTGQLRFVQASLNAPGVNFVVDGKTLGINLAYANINDYTTLKSGSHHIQVIPVSASTPIFDGSVSINNTGNQTLLISGPTAHLQSDLVTDGGTTATTGDGHVRVINAASSLTAADVYLVPAGTSLAGLQPVTSSLSYNKDTGYQLIVAGSYEVFLTSPGTVNVLLTTGPINLSSSQDQTVVALDGLSGGLRYTLLSDP